MAELGNLSGSVKAILPELKLSEVEYKDLSRNVIEFAEAFNFCLDTPHNIALARALDRLSSQGVAKSELKKYLVDLTGGRQTAGTLCELLFYDWLGQHRVPFETQVAVAGCEILNPAGSNLDGKLTGSLDVYFDVKTFGFQEAMVGRLTERLEADQPGAWIAVEGSWDVSAEFLQDLLGFSEFSKLATELRSQPIATRGLLRFIRRDRRSVQVTHRAVDPYAAAEEHGSYIFRYAKQFARRKPFLLFLAYHPWLGGQALSINFASYRPIYTRSFARRTFMQHLKNDEDFFGLPKSDVSRLVSGIGFLNVSHILQENGGPDPREARLDLYLNPNATNKLGSLTFDPVRWEYPNAFSREDFAHDNY